MPWRPAVSQIETMVQENRDAIMGILQTMEHSQNAIAANKALLDAHIVGLQKCSQFIDVTSGKIDNLSVHLEMLHEIVNGLLARVANLERYSQK